MTEPQALVGSSPLNLPAVTVKGQVLTLRRSLLTAYVLDKHGVDGRKLPELLAQEGPGRITMFMEIFAAMVAHHFAPFGKPIPNADYWASQIEESQWPEILSAIHQALVKAAPAGTNSAQTLPA